MKEGISTGKSTAAICGRTRLSIIGMFWSLRGYERANLSGTSVNVPRRRHGDAIESNCDRPRM